MLTLDALKLEPIEKLLKVLRPEDGVPEASQRKPEKCLVGEVKSKLCSLVQHSELIPSLRHPAKSPRKASCVKWPGTNHR